MKDLTGEDQLVSTLDDEQFSWVRLGILRNFNVRMEKTDKGAYLVTERYGNSEFLPDNCTVIQAWDLAEKLDKEEYPHLYT